MTASSDPSSVFDLLGGLIKSLPQSDNPPRIIDGGCHAGTFSLALKELLPNAQILAFEPDPDSARLARKNLNPHKDIELIEAALGAEKGSAVLHRGPRSATNSLLPRPKSGDRRPYFPDDATLDQAAEVNVTTVDDICAEQNYDHLHILKLDLQGGELAALEGAARLLCKGAIDIILTEIVFIGKYQEQPLFPDIWQAIAAYGYSFYAVVDLKIGLYHKETPGPRHNQWNQADAFFLSPRLRAAIDRIRT